MSVHEWALQPLAFDGHLVRKWLLMVLSGVSVDLRSLEVMVILETPRLRCM